VTAETCPHYLLLTEQDMDRLRPFGKINPPLRSPAAVSGLWDRIGSGVVDMISSDHAPSDLTRKSRRDDTFANASGIPGVQTLLTLTYGSMVGQRRMSVLRLADLVAANPARTFGLAPRKGQLTAGADADVVILDPSASTRISSEAMQSSAKWSPYDGMEVPGQIRLTMVRGQVVYDGSLVTGQPGYGRHIAPQRDRASART
jgi:allantoinase